MNPIEPLATSALIVLGKYALSHGAEVAGKLSQEAISLATKLLQEIRSHFETQAAEKARKAFENYVADPEDYQAIFEKYLKLELEANQAFRQEITALLQRFQAAAPETEVNISVRGSGAVATQGGVAAGEGGVAVKGNVEGGIHISDAK